ncbi:MAG: helix-turn-helix domain-containing protein, partial [Armatimonadetes bacterium]|nr:helix-turn-helix domain-containing protein [Armatimonadota bacterium]
MSRPVTQSPLVPQIVTGQFAESPSYSVWRPHGTKDYLLILTVDGGGRFGHVGGDVPAAPGDLVIVLPGTPHDYATARGAAVWQIVWAHFLPRPEWNEWIAAIPEAAPGIVRLQLGAEGVSCDAVQAALEAMNTYANGGGLRGTAFAMNALEAALLHADAANPATANRVRFDERVLLAMERLGGARLADTASLSELADAVCLSPSRLSHLFKAQTGFTPAQFQERERLRRARELLTLTNRSIGAIAEEVGFASPFYFSLRFKKHTGQSPR